MLSYQVQIRVPPRLAGMKRSKYKAPQSIKIDSAFIIVIKDRQLLFVRLKLTEMTLKQIV